ncbi:uncharacterized protein LOC124366990 [Homalodisca vitripennis]|uniref:uncharacterized protein LOC124366990 n=1 Tax=Homalodisca vitripennis TaxID=197043 RepID=UPI001EEBC2DF|nr:uncharacterized protein LOC124366990 [Homalodisca vitripennis]
MNPMSSSKQTILMGDINVDNLTENNDNTNLQELLATYDIVRMNLPPTQITSETKKSIDWICTNIDPESIKTSIILTGLSDHTAQTFSLKTSKIIKKTVKERKRLFTNRELTRFKEKLQTQTWDQILMEEDVNHAYKSFHSALQLILNETCPLKLVKGRQHKKRQVWDDECNQLKNAYISALEIEQRTGLAKHKAQTVERKREYDLRLKHLRREQTTAHINQAENKSKSLWQQGIFPTVLKTAKIYPKYKKGPRSEPGSCRPISLIPTFSKIIEKIVLTRLLNHLEQHNLLTNKQHGFLRGRSTTTALVKLTEHIIYQLEEGCSVTSLFLDFSKAFDCLNHDQLLQKLRALGVGGKEADWFKCYLKGRKQSVEINYTQNYTNYKIQSATTEVRRGVPQGSVLGPVLFLLLTNDMPNCLDDACSI